MFFQTNFTCYPMTVTTTDQTSSSTNSYLVAQLSDMQGAKDFFKGGTGDINNHPQVGAAIPLGRADNFTPRVFCFLPLPHNPINETGLGFHINGYFAINQSRTSIKVNSQEDGRHVVSIDRNVVVEKHVSILKSNLFQGTDESDHAVRWNLFLLENLLPRCIARMAEALAKMTKTEEGIPTDKVISFNQIIIVSYGSIINKTG